MLRNLSMELKFAELLYRGYLDGEGYEGNFGRHMGRVFATLASLPLPHPDVRFQEHVRGAPRAHALIDTFPVDIRGPPDAYNPKYGKKVVKFQLVCTVRGQPLSLLECGEARINDGKHAAERGVDFDLAPGEVVVADKAYIGVSHMMTPVKMGKGRLSEGNARFNQWHQIVRSPAERVNARLHSYACMRCRRFDKGVTCNLIRIVVALDSMRKPPATDFVVATNAAEAASRAWGWTPPHEETEEGSKAISHIEKEDVVRYILTSQPKLDGKTSTKRKDAANSPMYKPFTLKYELECKKTGAERSLCLCKKCKLEMKKYHAREAKKKEVAERRETRQARRQAKPSDANRGRKKMNSRKPTQRDVQVAAEKAPRPEVGEAPPGPALPKDDWDDIMLLLGLE